MPTDNRISTLPELSVLYSDIDLLTPVDPSASNADADVLFLITKSGVKNEKITFKNLKSSILGNTVSLSGAQTISGEKTFADICTFEDTVFLNEVVDTTYSGDISGYNFVAETGLFEKLGIGSGFADKTRTPEYALHVEGDVCIEGELNALGEIEFGGNLGLNDVNVSGDLFVGGSGVFNSGLHVSGNANFSGSIDVVGTGNFGGDLNVTGDIYVENKIAHVGDDDTYIQFSDNQVAIKATGSSVVVGESIEFSVSGDKKLVVDSDGRLLINSDTALGQLSMSGSAYVDELYITGQNGGWEKLVPKGYDESVHFTTNLIGGETTYEIDFPKTFGSIPVVHATLQSESGEPVRFFNISNITNSSYFISFDQALTSDKYSIETQATANASYSLHQTTTQSFKDYVIEGQDNYTITYPSSFAKSPTVSATLERKISFSATDPGDPGETFVDSWEYYIAVDTDTWRRSTMAEVIRTESFAGDTDFDNDFYYVCIDDTLWGKIALTSLDGNPEPSDSDEDGFDYDDNYIYVKTSEGWKRAAVATWTSESSATIVPYMISEITDTDFKINFASALTSQYYVHVIASR